MLHVHHRCHIGACEGCHIRHPSSTPDRGPIRGPRERRAKSNASRGGAPDLRNCWESARIQQQFPLPGGGDCGANGDAPSARRAFGGESARIPLVIATRGVDHARASRQCSNANCAFAAQTARIMQAAAGSFRRPRAARGGRSGAAGRRDPESRPRCCFPANSGRPRRGKPSRAPETRVPPQVPADSDGILTVHVNALQPVSVLMEFM